VDKSDLASVLTSGYLTGRVYFTSAGFVSPSVRFDDPIAGEPASAGCPLGYPDSETPVIEFFFDSGVAHPHPAQNESMEIPIRIVRLRKDII